MQLKSFYQVSVTGLGAGCPLVIQGKEQSVDEVWLMQTPDRACLQHWL